MSDPAASYAAVGLLLHIGGESPADLLPPSCPCGFQCSIKTQSVTNSTEREKVAYSSLYEVLSFQCQGTGTRVDPLGRPKAWVRQITSDLSQLCCSSKRLSGTMFSKDLRAHCHCLGPCRVQIFRLGVACPPISTSGGLSKRRSLKKLPFLLNDAPKAAQATNYIKEAPS